MVFSPTNKLLWCGATVEQWLRTKQCVPVIVEIAPTSYCSANCSWCFFKHRSDSGEISVVLLTMVLRSLKSLGVRAINWTGGGEPSMYPHFEEIVNIAYTLGFNQGLFTNAYVELPQYDYFDWIRISLTDRGFGAIVKPKNKFGICVNLTNDTNVEDLCKQAKDFGAMYFQVRPALANNNHIQPSYSIPTGLKKHETSTFKVHLTEYKFQDATKARQYDMCYGYNLAPSIDWMGNVATCLYMSHIPEYILGNLHSHNFKEIWTHMNSTGIPVCNECQNCCKNHEINKILSSAINTRDVDFL